ncbi:MAG: hypothetical protein J6X28_01565 [Bacilli bacterium]|nr:hypothetical protein [Bacilli bacterium]
MNKEKKGKELSKNFWIIVISVCVLLSIVILACYVAFFNREPEVVEKELDGGYVTLNYTTEVNALTILGALPTTDTVGMNSMSEGQYFDFSVDVNLSDAPKVEYEISLIKDNTTSNIPDDDIRIYLEKEESGTYTKLFGPEKFTPSKNYSSVGSELGSMVLANVKKIKSETDNYRLRIWMSEDALATGGSYSVAVDIHAVAK